MLNLKTGIKPWGAGQENGFFGFAGLDCALEFDGVVVSALRTENGLDDLVGDGVEFVGPEDFH